MNKFYYYQINLLLVSIFFSISLTSCLYDIDDIDDIKHKSEHLKTVLQLVTSNDNPRNSEGDFIELNTGQIMFIYSHFFGDHYEGDSSPAYLAARYSDDGGITWTKNDEIIIENEGCLNVMSASLIRLNNGDIALFYIRKKSHDDSIPMMRISKDESKSWSEAVPCIVDKKGYFVLNNDRVIQLKNGRLLLPVSRHRTPGGNWSDVGEIFCYYSDNNGKSWYSSTAVPNNTGIVIQEPGLIEMKNGVVMMYMRSTKGYQQLSYSYNSGESWSNIEPSNITSPLSPATIKNIPDTSDWLIVWNNTISTNKGYSDKRTPLTAAISKDEGISWTNIKNILDNPYGNYCYSAIHFVDKDYVLISYLSGLKTDIVLINRKWFNY